MGSSPGRDSSTQIKPTTDYPHQKIVIGLQKTWFVKECRNFLSQSAFLSLRLNWEDLRSQMFPVNTMTSSAHYAYFLKGRFLNLTHIPLLFCFFKRNSTTLTISYTSKDVSYIAKFYYSNSLGLIRSCCSGHEAS